RTGDHAQMTLAGPAARTVLEKALGEKPPESQGLRIWEAKFPAGTTSQIRSNDALGAGGFDIVCPRTFAEAAWEALVAAGAHPAGAETYHVLRVEAGTPLYGQDLDENNLAMEIDRTAQAISYTKGCFPGQEPICRARDLGHVNWSFRGLKLAGNDLPARGTKLLRNGEAAGHITSAVYSPGAATVLALGYV